MHRTRIVGDGITYVGLDVHKEGIVVAVAEGGLRGEVREYGRIANTAAALDRLMRKLGGEGIRLRFCYEAGPCGYRARRTSQTMLPRPSAPLALRPRTAPAKSVSASAVQTA
jgi:hypothetical protein